MDVLREGMNGVRHTVEASSAFELLVFYFPYENFVIFFTQQKNRNYVLELLVHVLLTSLPHF
jgi:hypothetical protein